MATYLLYEETGSFFGVVDSWRESGMKRVAVDDRLASERCCCSPEPAG
jgi:hypothetical protein